MENERIKKLMENERIKKLIEEYGTVKYDGKTYVPTQMAYISPSWSANTYEAHAICLDDEADEDGWLNTYEIYWDILDDFDLEKHDEMYACDWDNPSDTKELGYDFDPNEMSIY